MAVGGSVADSLPQRPGSLNLELPGMSNQDERAGTMHVRGGGSVADSIKEPVGRSTSVNSANKKKPEKRSKAGIFAKSKNSKK
jgi:hypothetical protein